MHCARRGSADLVDLRHANRFLSIRGIPSVNKDIVIRPEIEADRDAITQVTQEAFRTLKVSNQTEHFIINALRDAGVLTVSLVAEADGQVVGHIAFSPVVMSDSSPNWYGLGPVSVLPEHQRQGIGSSLIEQGLSQLKSLNTHGCCVVGHPEYYPRFGFKNTNNLTLEGVPPEAFFVLTFDSDEPKGTVQFHHAFMAQG